MDNKLNIQITVDDEQMASLIKGNLESLPEEKIQEIFSSALTEFLKTNDGQKLFYTRQYYSSEPQPTRLLTQMVENAVSKDLLKPCVDEFVNVIKDNYESLIKNCIIETFSNMFFTEMKSVVLKSELNTMLHNGLNNK
jgi:flagellar basal body-associated protein FliL